MKHWLHEQIRIEMFGNRTLKIYQTRGGGGAVVSVRLPPFVEFVEWGECPEEALQKAKHRIEEILKESDDEIPF